MSGVANKDVVELSDFKKNHAGYRYKPEVVDYIVKKVMAEIYSWVFD